MAVYDLEEQDQLEDLKAWWTLWGSYVTAAVVAVCIAIVGIQGWRWWQHSQAEQASLLYNTISTAAHAKDLAKAQEAVGRLTDKYARTSYAPRGAMVVSRMLFDSGDKAGAKAQLQWVIDRGNEDELKQIARYRLAEVQFDDKQYDDALRTLDAKHDDPFAALYADLRGDVLAAAKRTDDARAAYQVALAKIEAKSQYRNYIEVKLNALGGPLAAGAAASVPAAAGATPAPGAVAPPPASAASATSNPVTPPSASSPITPPAAPTARAPASIAPAVAIPPPPITAPASTPAAAPAAPVTTPVTTPVAPK